VALWNTVNALAMKVLGKVRSMSSMIAWR